MSQRKWGKDAYRPPFSFQHIIAHPKGMRVDSDNEKYSVVVWGLTHMKSHAKTNTKFFTGWCKCWPPLTPTSDPQNQRKSQAKFCKKTRKLASHSTTRQRWRVSRSWQNIEVVKSGVISQSQTSEGLEVAKSVQMYGPCQQLEEDGKRMTHLAL